MLMCQNCGKVIANTDPATVRYGLCATCPTKTKENKMSIVISEGTPHIVGEFNGKSVQINEFKGKRYIDVRKYFVDKATGKDIPTKKGISIAMDELDELINLLSKVEELKAKGEV